MVVRRTACNYDANANYDDGSASKQMNAAYVAAMASLTALVIARQRA